MRWAILTGEYPPKLGGVSDYTRLVAESLAMAGDEVHVWAQVASRTTPECAGVTVHRLPDNYGPRSLPYVDSDLRRLGHRVRILVQYVPHAFGWKAMNVPFCVWLSNCWRKRFEVMFHEVSFPLAPGQPWKHELLGNVTGRMARMIHRAAERSWISIPAWAELLRRLVPGRNAIEWLPVPSTLPTKADPAQIAKIRERVAAEPGTRMVGHFGTFGTPIARLLTATLPRLLRTDHPYRVLLVGLGSQEFRDRLLREHGGLDERILATGPLSSKDAANWLASSDMLLQPYIDGVSSRRTSVMAGLALGLPIVTTEGCLSEPLWRESGAVNLVQAGDDNALIASCEALLQQETMRKQLGHAARLFYRCRPRWTLSATRRASTRPSPSSPPG
jgi:glycosyltransferase involved in cell wall biosynthesis